MKDNSIISNKLIISSKYDEQAHWYARWFEARNEMTPQQFAECAHHLVRAFEACRDGGTMTADDSLVSWELGKGDGDRTHLFHPPVFATHRGGKNNDLQRGDDGDAANGDRSMEEEDVLADEDAMAVPSQEQSRRNNNDATQVRWDFSILYSGTYCVPVLYFRAQTMDGSPCERSKILQWLPDQSINDKWDFISQEEHPINGIPSFFLHPCRTPNKLADLSKSAIEEEDGDDDDGSILLWAWMSMILPAVNHPVSSVIYKEVLSKLNEGKKKVK